jgi:hypothetical protein
MRTVGNAVITGQQIGAVEASVIVGQMPIVQCTRNLVHINACRRDDISARSIIVNHSALNNLQEEGTAYNNSPNTTLGRRIAFEALIKQQIEDFGTANFDFFAFLSTFKCTNDTKGKNRSHKSAITERSHHLLVNTESGYITNGRTFTLHKVYI